MGKISIWVGMVTRDKIYTMRSLDNNDECLMSEIFFNREDAAARYGLIAKAEITLGDMEKILHCPYQGDPEHSSVGCRLGRHRSISKLKFTGGSE